MECRSIGRATTEGPFDEQLTTERRDVEFPTYGGLVPFLQDFFRQSARLLEGKQEAPVLAQGEIASFSAMAVTRFIV